MKNRNYSRKREAMLDKLRSTTCHPTADWLFQELREDYPDLSLGTVYRNLSLFKEEGDIISVGVVNGQERFDGRVDSHGHFICKICNAVVDVDVFAQQAEFEKHMQGLENYKIEKFECTAYGACDMCVTTPTTDRSGRIITRFERSQKK